MVGQDTPEPDARGDRAGSCISQAAVDETRIPRSVSITRGRPRSPEKTRQILKLSKRVLQIKLICRSVRRRTAVRAPANIKLSRLKAALLLIIQSDRRAAWVFVLLEILNNGYSAEVYRIPDLPKIPDSQTWRKADQFHRKNEVTESRQTWYYDIITLYD